MADDNRSRPYRSNDPYGRPQGGPGHQSGSDPLAELARLIGQQNDAPPAYGQPAADWRGSADQFRSPDQYAPNSTHPASSRDAPRYDAPYPQHYDEQPYADAQHADPGYADPRFAGSYPEAQQYNGQDYRARRYGAQPYDAPQYPDQQYADPRYNDQQYGTPQYADTRASQPYAGHSSAYPDQAGYPQSYSQPPFAQHRGDPYYRGAPPAHDSDEDQAPRRRGGLVTVLAVLALAVVGTAAAFGYRAVFGTSGTPIPPVIKADTAPAKVVPATQAGEQGGKAIQDRVGAGNQPERMVGREEAPVDIAARAAGPRVVFPGPTANPIAPLPTSPIPPAASSLAPVGTPTAAPTPTEPKRIRTVAIRPDQPETGSARSPAAEESAPRPGARQQPAPAASNGPLSLSPSSASPPPQPRQSMRTAAAPAAAPVSAGNGGGYSVQVTSQRSEAEAQAAYAQLQSKFPSVLGNRQMVIRRADLGDKGVYYRAQLPFGSQGEASEFCGKLKDAGGQCVVQRN